MDKPSLVLIHVNPALHNQRLYGDYLQSGFSKLGFKTEITHSPKGDADLHACIGPHFAYEECLNKITIYIDRCLWGDDLEYVTVGRLKPNGGMVYPKDCDDQRPKPELMPMRRHAGDTIALYDYGMTERIRAHKHRFHPAQTKTTIPLIDDLEGCCWAFGWRSSALFTALVQGLHVICYDRRSPVYGCDTIGREQLLNNLSYAQWSGKEIESGEALEYVINNS